jgi:hypothetical protein
VVDGTGEFGLAAGELQFNFRRRVGLDVALDALRAARLERGVSVDDLWRSAEAAGADGFMRPYLEVIA